MECPTQSPGDRSTGQELDPPTFCTPLLPFVNPDFQLHRRTSQTSETHLQTVTPDYILVVDNSLCYFKSASAEWSKCNLTSQVECFTNPLDVFHMKRRTYKKYLERGRFCAVFVLLLMIKCCPVLIKLSIHAAPMAATIFYKLDGAFVTFKPRLFLKWHSFMFWPAANIEIGVFQDGSVRV